MDTYISLDLETTGYSPEMSDIIEIGAWKVEDGVVKDKFSTLVRPIVYIPRNIQELTGITNEAVKDCDTIVSVLLEFYEWCGDLPFLGHNIKFDYDFLCAKGKPMGLDFTSRGTRSGIDTLKLSRDLLKLKSNKLIDVVNYFNISVDMSNGAFHRASYDSYMTKLVYDRFKLLYGSVLSVNVPELLTENTTQYGKVVSNATLEFY